MQGKSDRLFNIPLWERALDLWLLENGMSALSHCDDAAADMCAKKWLTIVAYIKKHGYELSTYSDRKGFRIV